MIGLKRLYHFSFYLKLGICKFYLNALSHIRRCNTFCEEFGRRMFTFYDLLVVSSSLD